MHRYCQPPSHWLDLTSMPYCATVCWLCGAFPTSYCKWVRVLTPSIELALTPLHCLQAEKWGSELLTEDVEHVDLTSRPFTVRSSDTEVCTRFRHHSMMEYTAAAMCCRTLLTMYASYHTGNRYHHVPHTPSHVVLLRHSPVCICACCLHANIDIYAFAAMLWIKELK